MWLGPPLAVATDRLPTAMRTAGLNGRQPVVSRGCWRRRRRRAARQLAATHLECLLSGEREADLVDMAAEAGALGDAFTCRVEVERVVETTLALWLPSWLPGHVHELGYLLGAGQRCLGHDADPGRVDLLVDNAGFDPGELQGPERVRECPERR